MPGRIVTDTTTPQEATAPLLWDVDKLVDRLSRHTWQSDHEQDNDFVTVGVAVFVAMKMQRDYEVELVAKNARIAELEAALTNLLSEAQRYVYYRHEANSAIDNAKHCLAGSDAGNEGR